jgi:anthranilate synthase component 1
VLSQRFERRTFATPFEVYRALRVVNPSPYMVYMQVRDKWRALVRGVRV